MTPEDLATLQAAYARYQAAAWPNDVATLESQQGWPPFALRNALSGLMPDDAEVWASIKAWSAR